MMALKRLASYLITAFWWSLIGARIVADVIGYSTLPEDAKVASSYVDDGLDLLLAAPWWAVLGAGFLSTLWLIYVSWPRDEFPKLSASGQSLSNEVYSLYNRLYNYIGYADPQLPPDLLGEMLVLKNRLKRKGINLKIEEHGSNKEMVSYWYARLGVIAPMIARKDYKEAQQLIKEDLASSKA